MPLSITRPFLSPSNESATITTMNAIQAISHALEDVVLADLPDAQLVVGIQRMSLFHQQLPRYRTLAAACRSLWVCAVYDTEPPSIDGITFVPIDPMWPVADEWFVVMNAPGFASALLAQEVRDPRRGYERGFQTMFTSDPRLVNAICRTMAIELDLRIVLPTLRDPQAQQINLRRFNKMALEYQERQLPRRTTPVAVYPRWNPPMTPSYDLKERVIGRHEV